MNWEKVNIAPYEKLMLVELMLFVLDVYRLGHFSQSLRFSLFLIFFWNLGRFDSYAKAMRQKKAEQAAFKI